MSAVILDGKVESAPRINDKISLDGAFSYVFYSDFDVIDIKLTSPQLLVNAAGDGPGRAILTNSRM